MYCDNEVTNTVLADSTAAVALIVGALTALAYWTLRWSR